jgi:hypothetical protein
MVVREYGMYEGNAVGERIVWNGVLSLLKLDEKGMKHM